MHYENCRLLIQTVRFLLFIQVMTILVVAYCY